MCHFLLPTGAQGSVYDDLMCTIYSVCQDDLLVVGDFNTRVGSNHPELDKGEVLRVIMELVKLIRLEGHF